MIITTVNLGSLGLSIRFKQQYFSRYAIYTHFSSTKIKKRDNLSSCIMFLFSINSNIFRKINILHQYCKQLLFIKLSIYIRIVQIRSNAYCFISNITVDSKLCVINWQYGNYLWLVDDRLRLVIDYGYLCYNSIWKYKYICKIKKTINLFDKYCHSLR